MSWSASTGPVERVRLWNAIDLLTATQEGADQEALNLQLHHAKAAAKCVANAFDVGEYPELSVSIGGHVFTGPGSGPDSLNVWVSSPNPPVSAAAAIEAARQASTEARETTLEAQAEEQTQDEVDKEQAAAESEQPNLPEQPSEPASE